MTAARVPAGLDTGGRELWRAVAADHDLDAVQKVQLLEACRAKDRCDHLDAMLRGDTDTWATLVPDPVAEGVFDVRVTGVMSKANECANQMKQLLAALRLPDAKGKRPQQRGGARGSYTSSGAGAKVSPMIRDRSS